MALEQLALLTEKIQHLLGSGGRPDWTWEDIAHVLARADLTNSETWLIRTKFMREPSHGDLVAYLYGRSMEGGGQKWMKERSHRPKLILDICKLAVNEHVGEHTCPWCHGVAQRMIDNMPLECSACGGSGRRPPTDFERQRALGIDDREWPSWGGRYDYLLDLLGEIERSACNKILSQMHLDSNEN
jgi:hypothetical protein